MKEQMNKGKENDQTAGEGGGEERERERETRTSFINTAQMYCTVPVSIIYVYIYTKYKGCVDRHLFLVFSYFILYEV